MFWEGARRVTGRADVMPLGRAGGIPGGQSRSHVVMAEAPVGHWTAYAAVVGSAHVPEW